MATESNIFYDTSEATPTSNPPRYWLRNGSVRMILS